jgi:hypothetical protein
MSVLGSYRADRYERESAHAMSTDLSDRWRQAAIGSGTCLQVDTASGPTQVPPKVTRVHAGHRFDVALPPGMIADDLRQNARRLAAGMNSAMLRIIDRGPLLATVVLLDHDPLDGVLPLDLPQPDRRILLGVGEDGAAILEDLHRSAHTIVQGVTRSGKSVWTYGALAQLAGQPDVIVGGCDPTGLLWRPFTGSRHAEWQVSGLADLDAHEKLLQRLVDEMDARIRDLPLDRDTIAVTSRCPLLVVVLEELAGLLRALDAAKTRDDDPGKRIRMLIGRLLAEGAKVGVRVIILVQRAEAAVVGAFERAMCSLRISFRTDNRASVELLHPGCDPTIADAHTTSEPGIALVSMPGRPLARIRAPYLGGYPEFAAAVGHFA